jgi:hypothetical protein
VERATSDERRATSDERRATSDERRATSDERRATSDVWSTIRAERTVLAVARTVTATTRLLDALELFRSDYRVQVVFAVDSTSVFSAGVSELLASVGARVLSWDQLTDQPVDLAVSASENVSLGPLRVPVVVLPHGVGFQKYVPAPEHPAATRLSGLVPDPIRRELDLDLVVSHPGQVAQLAAVSGETPARTVVTGDICFDRLRASLRLREVYRRELGLDEHHRLVLLSSTWRQQSLWSRRPRLPERMLAELPVDEYRVAWVAHPNAWFGHGPWQVRSWLADARDAGLLMIPPTAGWQATLAAADVVVGDHGSVTFYAVAAGLPVLLAAFGDEAVPGTPLAEFGRTAPRLRDDVPIRRQLEEVLTGHDPARYDAVTGAAFDRVGQALPTLRTLLYRRLDLPEPRPTPPVRAWPAPQPESSAVRAFAVAVDTTGHDTVAIDRRPAILTDHETEPLERTLAVYDDEPDPRLAESASVIVREPVTERADAQTWARRAFRQYPGARVAAAAIDDGCLAMFRDGSIMTLQNTTGVSVDPLILAAVCAALPSGQRGGIRHLDLVLGARHVPVLLSVSPG